MAPWHWPYRTVYMVGFLVCAGLLAYAIYAEVYMGLIPCPLCVFQRIAFIWMGFWFLVGGLHAPRSRARWFYCVMVVIGAIWGAVVAARHLWLQSLPPDQVPSCGPGLGYLFDTFSWLHAFKLVFSGSGECAAVNWKFLGLSMPGWTLIWYVLLSAFAIHGAVHPFSPKQIARMRQSRL